MRLVTLAQMAIGLPRWMKRTLIITVDASLCVLAVWVAYFLRLSIWVPLYGAPGTAVIGSLALALPIFTLAGVYRPVFRHAEGVGFQLILFSSLIYALAYTAIFAAWSVPGVPRTVGIIQPVLLFVFMVLARIAAHQLLHGVLDRRDNRSGPPRVLIYGAGVSGRQLAAAIQSRREMKVAGFLDDAKELQGASVNGIRVYPPSHVLRLTKKMLVDEVLLAIPSATQHRRNEILSVLRALRVRVRTLPDIIELALSEQSGNNITNLDIHDLLGRDVVESQPDLMDKHIRGKTTLVTGAGGSIGSELCRQILSAHPQKLLLLDSNEYALYSIHRELELIIARGREKDPALSTQLVPLLGSVCDARRINEVISCWLPSHVYHAAAYKHVPLVEHNPIQGVENNVFGTLIVAQTCVRHKIPNFVLVSTDKAVRPTNTMGATKRFAEMVLQALAQDSDKTCLSMVRFGNVLGSSGSVVPLFRQQIMAGGPVTITDERITRFFMTIPEAAQLVIQAGAMASGGEVFVLDMGEPVRIVDLARNMIELSGLTVRDASNPFGDIELKTVGLRPGEKLYEELLIKDAPIVTQHPRIRKAIEHFLPSSELQVQLDNLRAAIEAGHPDQIRTILCNTVYGFNPNAGNVDYVYMETQNVISTPQVA
ncbi:nucleoside-diphosphate sugar epimerase/dehydratase [Sphingomonas sp. PB1R3]|uniref:nucleoside-diphosphate sugar epimerase/dehydratase n=1 Tax=Sphingomonas flavida TaxID=3096154 RepID=UPI002FC61220